MKIFEKREAGGCAFWDMCYALQTYEYLPSLFELVMWWQATTSCNDCTG